MLAASFSRSKCPDAVSWRPGLLRLDNVVTFLEPQFRSEQAGKHNNQEVRKAMSEENNAQSPVAGIIETLKTNPKAMYAAGGALVVIILALVMGGGGSDQPKQYKTASVAPGQSVTIQSPNIGNTILVTTPGQLGSVSDEEDEAILCRNVVAGTNATVMEEQTVNYIGFVRVTLNDGECAGKQGWMPKVNIKP
jgi:hypothetical protein